MMLFPVDCDVCCGCGKFVCNHCGGTGKDNPVLNKSMARRNHELSEINEEISALFAGREYQKTETETEIEYNCDWCYRGSMTCDFCKKGKITLIQRIYRILFHPEYEFDEDGNICIYGAWLRYDPDSDRMEIYGIIKSNILILN